MKLSQVKIYHISKMKDKLTTTELLEGSGYLTQVQSGLFVHMNLMKRVINNIDRIIKEELDNISCLEISLNQIQSSDIWKKSERYDTYGSEMFKLKDRNDKEMIITGTNEELVTIIAKDYIKSYKDLNITFYQINNKFRDEIRCSNGLIRCKEFSMMDAYSFHESEEKLDIQYDIIRNAYIKIFDRLGLDYRIEAADSGEIGGSMSEEFVVSTSDGDVEIGHIFKLGTKYSEKMEATFMDKDGVKNNMVMGCYGIGVTRLAQVLADVNRIDNCLNFDENISAFKYGIVVGNVNDSFQMKVAIDIYESLKSKGFSVYIDDRDIRIGTKLNEIDLIGISNKILVGNNVKEGYYEVKKKSNDSWDKIMKNTKQDDCYLNSNCETD